MHLLSGVGVLAQPLDERELRFQPINRIDTGETTHHEVLIRLRNDDGKLVGEIDPFFEALINFAQCTAYAMESRKII